MRRSAAWSHHRAPRPVTARAAAPRPPQALIRLMNPALRALLPTPIGRLIAPFALLEFDGARTGRHYRVPVGWHDIDGRPVVFTPARWRVNLRGGVAVTVHHRGRRYATT